VQDFRTATFGRIRLYDHDDRAFSPASIAHQPAIR
jgi:hypothetical protein